MNTRQSLLFSLTQLALNPQSMPTRDQSQDRDELDLRELEARAILRAIRPRKESVTWRSNEHFFATLCRDPSFGLPL